MQKMLCHFYNTHKAVTGLKKAKSVDIQGLFY